MRLTTLLRRLLGVTQMYVKQVEMAADGPLTVSVEPSWRRSRCGTCGKRAPRYDRQPVREWRHLSWGRMPAWLRYAPWRVSCRRCSGVKVEQVPWASGSSVFTSGFEELAAYLAQVTDRTAVSRLLGISWVTVGSIVERIVARRLDGARFTKLRRIGVDEFSYRKRHRYLTIVVDHDERRVVWAGRGRSAETLGAFFEQLGPGGARIVTAPGGAEAGPHARSTHACGWPASEQRRRLAPRWAALRPAGVWRRCVVRTGRWTGPTN